MSPNVLILIGLHVRDFNLFEIVIFARNPKNHKVTVMVN